LSEKILKIEDLESISSNLKRSQKIIVTTNGSYDIMHSGHVRGLALSKSYGDVLIVGINSDESIRTYKGPQRPIVSEKERVYMLSSLMFVDYICLFDEVEIGSRLISLVKPHIHTTGAEWGEKCPEIEAIRKYGVKLKLIPKFDNMSTTHLVNKIIEVCGSDYEKYDLKQQREILSKP
jgi:rfaE bifunctional protein nucleotidyltransferase chain/domain